MDKLFIVLSRLTTCNFPKIDTSSSLVEFFVFIVSVQSEMFKYIEEEKNERLKSKVKYEEAIKRKNLRKEVYKDCESLCIMWQKIFKQFLIILQTGSLKMRLLYHLRYKFTNKSEPVDCFFMNVIDNTIIKNAILQYNYDDYTLQICLEKYENDNEDIANYLLDHTLMKKHVKNKNIFSGNYDDFKYDYLLPAKYYYSKNMEGLKDIKIIANINFIYDDTWIISNEEIHEAYLEIASYHILRILNESKYLDNDIDLIKVIDEELPKMLIS